MPAHLPRAVFCILLLAPAAARAQQIANERAINAQLQRRRLDATVLPFKSRDEAFAALEEGKADAFASDKLLLLGVASKAKSPNSLALLADQLSFEPFVEIYRRWFGQLGRPSPILEAVFVLGAIPE